MTTHRPIPPARWSTRLVILLLVLCGSYVSYRAVHLAVVNDEVGLLDCVHRSSYKHLLLADDWDSKDHTLPWNPEGHFLNVLLAKPCVELLPVPEIVASRLPSLLGLGLFLWGVWRIGRQFPAGVTRVLITVALLSNVFLLDFFGLSRGYGLALGFTVLSLSFFMTAGFVGTESDESARRQAGIAVWLAFGAALSNLGFLHFYVALLATTLWPRWKNCLKVSWWSSALLLGIFYTPRVLAARSQDNLRWGGEVGFVHDTVGSLVRASFYDRPVSPELTGWMAGGLALTVLLLVYWSYRERIRAAFSLSILCVLVALLCTPAHMLLDVKYPEERAALFLIPVVTLTLGVVAAWSRLRWLRIFLWGLLLGFAGIGVKGANLSHTFTWRPSADIPSILLAVRGAHDETGQHVLLAHSDNFKRAVWYYAEHLLALNPKPSTADGTYLKTYDWLTVYERRGLYPYVHRSPHHLLPGTTFLLLDRDDERWLTDQLGGKLAPLQYYPASDLRLYRLTASEHRGTITHSDGSEYIGEFKDGQPNGQGTVTSTGGAVYVGEFKNGAINGQGVHTQPDGTTLQGEWRENQPYRTSGTIVLSDGTTEVGTWNHDGTKSGGTITWKDGREYKGDWKVVEGAPELPDGTGAMSWPDGRKYVGQFRDGMMDGTGKMTYPDGKVQDGLWKQGQFVGVSQ